MCILRYVQKCSDRGASTYAYEISSELGLSTSSVPQALKRLETRGYIVDKGRIAHAGRPPRSNYFITPTGRQLLLDNPQTDDGPASSSGAPKLSKREHVAVATIVLQQIATNGQVTDAELDTFNSKTSKVLGTLLQAGFIEKIAEKAYVATNEGRMYAELHSILKAAVQD